MLAGRDRDQRRGRSSTHGGHASTWCVAAGRARWSGTLPPVARASLPEPRAKELGQVGQGPGPFYPYASPQWRLLRPETSHQLRAKRDRAGMCPFAVGRCGKLQGWVCPLQEKHRNDGQKRAAGGARANCMNVRAAPLMPVRAHRHKTEPKFRAGGVWIRTCTAAVCRARSRERSAGTAVRRSASCCRSHGTDRSGKGRAMSSTTATTNRCAVRGPWCRVCQAVRRMRPQGGAGVSGSAGGTANSLRMRHSSKRSAPARKASK